jgi:hypothetical protein
VSPCVAFGSLSGIYGPDFNNASIDTKLNLLWSVHFFLLFALRNLTLQSFGLAWFASFAFVKSYIPSPASASDQPNKYPSVSGPCVHSGNARHCFRATCGSIRTSNQ